MLCEMRSILHDLMMPNLVLVVLDLGLTYRRNAWKLLRCHEDLLMALSNLEKHPLLSQVFIFSDDLVQRV